MNAFLQNTKILLWGDFESDDLIHSRETLNHLQSEFYFSKQLTNANETEKNYYYKRFFRFTDELDAIFDLIETSLENNIPIDKMIICLANLDKYAWQIRTKSFERAIPVNITAMIPMLDSPLIQELNSVFRILSNDFYTDDIINVLSSVHFQIEKNHNTISV